MEQAAMSQTPTPQTEQPDTGPALNCSPGDEPGDPATLGQIAKAIRHLSDRLDRVTAPQREYLSRAETAALFGIDKGTLTRIERGSFGPPPKRLMIGGAPKYHIADLRAWAASRPAPFGVKPSDFKPGKAA
jgi:hypothetical protein